MARSAPRNTRKTLLAARRRTRQPVRPVLLASRDLQRRQSVVSAFRNRGIEVTVTRDAQEALARSSVEVRACGADSHGANTFGLVLLDAEVLRIDGTEVVRQLRQTVRLAPIVVFGDGEEDRRACSEMGGDEFLPLSPDPPQHLLAWLKSA